MTDEHAEKIIGLLEAILNRLPGPPVVTWPAIPMPFTPAPPPGYPPLTSMYPGPVIQPPVRAADCGCAPNTVCMNVACPRRTQVSY